MNKLITDCEDKTDNIVVLCTCGCSDHLLKISRYKDDLDLNDFYVEVVPSSWTIWYRIKSAWKMLWWGPQVEEVIITADQMGTLIETLNDILAEIPDDDTSVKPIPPDSQLNKTSVPVGMKTFIDDVNK